MSFPEPPMLTSPQRAQDARAELVDISDELAHLSTANSPRQKLGTFGAVLQNKAFLALWLAQVFSQLADRIIFVVFIALIVKHFGASDRLNSYLYIAFTIPAILLTALAGVFVDRWPLRPVLVLTNLLRAALVALLPMGIGHGMLHFYALAFAISAVTQFFVPAESSAIPAVVPKSQLLTANSLFVTTMMASVIFGFALGDPLIGLFGIQNVHWAIASLFLMSALFVLGVGRIAPHQAKSEGASSLSGVFHELSEGVAYVARTPLLWQSILKLALLFSGVVALCILLVSYTRAFLYPDPAIASRKFAYIIAVSGVGMALSAMMVGQRFDGASIKTRLKLVYSGFSVIALGLLMLAMVEPLSRWLQNDILSQLPLFTIKLSHTYLWAFLMGIAAAAVAIPLQAILHERIPASMRGKVSGVQFTVLSTSSTVPVLLAGVGVEWIGAASMLIWMGLPLLAFGLLNLIRLSWPKPLKHRNS
jgi:MFS family permease